MSANDLQVQAWLLHLLRLNGIAPPQAQGPALERPSLFSYTMVRFLRRHLCEGGFIHHSGTAPISQMLCLAYEAQLRADFGMSPSFFFTSGPPDPRGYRDDDGSALYEMMTPDGSDGPRGPMGNDGDDGLPSYLGAEPAGPRMLVFM